ncbi:unnamed protein product [Angiostrongylus costaricensis]|uniref:Uncharacterized protein n=1 Tax=Angiostrongylus costaricensis TaxID=334426 RepID=A0A0R3PR34_ANGCS|nr:unnamed protein product [Angiostrongylus costaricensis]
MPLMGSGLLGLRIGTLSSGVLAMNGGLISLYYESEIIHRLCTLELSEKVLSKQFKQLTEHVQMEID